MSADILASDGDVVENPQDYDKALSVAMNRMLGHTQEESAVIAGVSKRTVANWESCSWWPDVKREAKDRWLQGLVGKARRTVERGVGEDPPLALKVLERMDMDFLPPKERLEHSGDSSAPIQITVTRRVVKADGT